GSHPERIHIDGSAEEHRYGDGPKDVVDGLVVSASRPSSSRSWARLDDEGELDEPAHHQAEVVAQRLARRVDCERRGPGEQLFERDLRFDAGEWRAETQVDAPAEPD